MTHDPLRNFIATMDDARFSLVPRTNTEKLEIIRRLASTSANVAQGAEAVVEKPLAWTADQLYAAIEQTLLHYRHSRIMTEDMESGYPLTDILTVDGESIQGGYDEIRYICDAIYNEVLTVAAPPAQPALADDARAAAQPITKEWCVNMAKLEPKDGDISVGAPSTAAQAGATLTDEHILETARHYAIDHEHWSPERVIAMVRKLIAVAKPINAVEAEAATDNPTNRYLFKEMARFFGIELGADSVSDALKKIAAKPVSAAAAKEGALIDAERWRRARRHGILKHGDPFSTTFVCNEDADAYVDTLLTTPTTTASADAEDAARYRWLRKEHFPTADNPPLAQVVWKAFDDRRSSQWANMIDGNDLDAAIDAARKGASTDATSTDQEP